MTWLRAMRDYITRPYYNLRDYLRYREAVEIADAAHEKDSDRYYVMPSMDGKLIIVDRKNFRLLKTRCRNCRRCRRGIHRPGVCQRAWESGNRSCCRPRPPGR